MLKEIDSELIPTSSALRYHGKGNNITHQIRDTVYLIRQASGEFFDKRFEATRDHTNNAVTTFDIYRVVTFFI